ncbi:hypothetical protein HU200_003423 [Digitaria exilis]|uniref:Uncharacterized protein n=1 Tax=Digitaria exilis TaxID=1010633 RepID=A0A835KUH3_9POAL|nr:hypothetical protein HU200_003423 [Digitaria exilis]CAB3462430.1 unnamed protein product [Digitaria exilis]
MDKQRNPKNGEVENNVFRRMILNQIAGDIDFDEENVPCNTPRNSVHSTFGRTSGWAVASSSGRHNTDAVSPGEYLRDPGSILSLQPWIFKRSGSQNNEERMHASGSRAFGSGKNLADCFRDAQAVEVCARSPGIGSGPGKGCGALRSRKSRRNLMKPLVPMDNSYVPHLYSENFEIEECTFAPVPSPASARPFIVTDGRRVISKSCYEPVPVPFNIGFEKEEFIGTSVMPGSVIGITPLPELKKLKQEDRDSHASRLGLPGSKRSSKSYGQAGLCDRLLLFSVGVSIGILSSSLSNKKEFDTLKGTLKQMENLVQDLQDELEMKEGLTVKELPNETSGEHDDDNSKVREVDPEPMSKIEAELEAELARLELNITSKRLEEESSDINDLDLEFIGDIVRGELKVDMIPRDFTDYSSESDHVRDSRESSPDYTRGANYPVSPRDLSIRLHKVIQRRLEDRIKELESALGHRQKQAQVQMMVTDGIFSERIISNSETGSSNQESPMFIQETSSMAEPYCLNLSGDALEAYDEAYEEFMRIADSPCTTSTNGKPQVTEDYLVNRGLTWGVEDSSRELNEVPTWEQVLKSVDPSRAQESDGCDGNESDDDDSKLLIQQILERTKQGSPVLINAQKLLFSVD